MVHFYKKSGLRIHALGVDWKSTLFRKTDKIQRRVAKVQNRRENKKAKDHRMNFESLINIRPRLGNRSIIIQDQKLREEVEVITRELLGGTKC
ncbi:MAG: hypothetical protein MAG431_01341 [Chloroflexi bacterium]|nr:hypothetical protein [Chloroflexota bacterium]